MLDDLTSEVSFLARKFAALNPKIVDQMKAWGKKNPDVSTLSYLALNRQRQAVDAMQVAVHDDAICSEERDGFVFYDVTDSFKIESDASFTLESYTSDPLDWAKAKYGFMDFDAVSGVSMLDFVQSRNCCLESLEEGHAKNTTDFGHVIGFRLEPRVYINDNDTMEYFQSSSLHHGRWRVTKKDKALKLLVRNALLDEFRPKTVNYDPDGKLLWKRFGTPHFVLKTQTVRNAIAEDVGLLLKRDPSIPLDCSERSRRLIMDSKGWVYDFEIRRRFINTPSLRLQRNLAFSFDEEWKIDPDARKAMDKLLDKIFDFWLIGGPKGKSLYTDPFGKTLADAFLYLLDGCPDFQYWNVILPIWERDVDELLWEALHFAADVCSWQKRCEFRYKYGDGGSGKDVGHIIEMNFFGTRDKNGVFGIIPATFFTSKQNPNPDAPSTTLDQMRSMRYLANNEVPSHTFFNCDALKALCEQEGVPILSRGLYADPVPWRPMGGIQLCSNHPLVLSDAQTIDTGNRRRINYLRMNARLSDSGKDVKKVINAGKLNPELLWIAKKFYEYLEKMPHADRLYPIPPRVVAETSELLDQKKGIAFKAWIEDIRKTEPASHISQGSLAAEIKDKVAAEFNIDKKDADGLLKSAGARSKRTGSGHYLTYLYPDASQFKAIRLL
mmetsp:Transcript_75192/g.121371  ORF Transcript_75192/g.121371 Transcript_75192/m.121371 type:complete len:666 (-) Transcript_75192:111-2108(-)